MREEGSEGERLLISFGSVNALCNFLTPIEALCLQALNKFCYKVAIPRSQARLGKYLFLFTFPQQHFQNLFQWDTSTKRIKKLATIALLRGLDLQFIPCRVKDAVYCFMTSGHDERVICQRYEPMLQGHKFQLKNQIAILRKKWLSFEVANWQNERLYLTGGEQQRNSQPTNQVECLDLTKRAFLEERPPQLNTARRGHSSMALGDNVFVVAGTDQEN